MSCEVKKGTLVQPVPEFKVKSSTPKCQLSALSEHVFSNFPTHPWMRQQHICMPRPLQWASPSGKGYQLIMSELSDDQFIYNSSQAQVWDHIIQGIIQATPKRQIKRDVQMKRWAFVLEGGRLAYLETQPFLKLINPLKELWVMD